MYVYSSTTATGCDSILWYDYTRYHHFYDTLNLSGCLQVSAHGQQWSTSGFYSNTNLTQAGCDSNWYYVVTVYAPDSTSETVVACDTAWVFGSLVSQSGNYSQTFTNQWGCDSIHEIQLTVNYSNNVLVDSSDCQPIFWNGQLIEVTGIYAVTFQNTSGCDSTVLMDYTRLDGDSIYQEVYACDSINWQGVVYSSDVLISEIGVNRNGCDSMYTTQIRIGSGITFSGEDSITVCPGDLPISLSGISPAGGSWNGQQVYNGAFGGDTTLEGVYELYYVMVSADGCLDSTLVWLTVENDCDPIVWIPKAFTPNGDGDNDSWTLSITNGVSLYIAIHDRWGNRIFTSDQLDFEWDGNWKGRPMPEGAYTYYLEYEYRRGKTFLPRKKYLYGTLVLLR